MTVLTDKRETLVGAVGLGGMPTPGTCLAGIAGIHLDRHRAMHDGFVSEHAVQFGKGPPRVGSIGLALILRGVLPASAPRSLADVSQVFQPDEGMGVSGHDAGRDHMIGVGFQPSLSPAHRHQAAGRGASAFLLQTLSQSRVMVGGGDQALAGMEGRLSLRVAGHGQVADTHIYPDHARLRFGRRICHLRLKRNQQVKLLLGSVIPELGRPDGGTSLDQGHVVMVAGIRQHHAPGKRQDADAAVRFERVVMPQLVGQRGGNIPGSLVQALVALLGQPCGSRLGVLLHLRPERLVGGSHLTGDGAGHLRRDLEAGAYLPIRAVLQAHLIAHLAMRKGVLAHVVQRIAVRELGLAQRGELLRTRLQLEFGDHGHIHRTSVLYLHQHVKGQELMKDALPPLPQRRNAAFLPVAEASGLRRRRSVRFKFLRSFTLDAKKCITPDGLILQARICYTDVTS
jgi:hypothetical protein